MPSIDSIAIIRNILVNDGYYVEDEDEAIRDSEAFEVFSYTTNWGGRCFLLAYNEKQATDALNGGCIHRPVLLWSRKMRLTAEGRKFLAENS